MIITILVSPHRLTCRVGREIAVHVKVVILKLNPNMLKFRRRANAIFTRMTKMTIALFKILRFRERADAMLTMMINVANALYKMLKI